MMATVRQFLPAFVLGTWGMVMLQVWASGRLEGLLAPKFHLLAAFSGVIFLMLAIGWIAALHWGPPPPKRGRKKKTSPQPQQSAFPILLIALWQIGPLLAAASLAPAAFSVSFIARRAELGNQLESGVAARYRGSGARLVQLAKTPETDKPLPLVVAEVVAAADIPEAQEGLENRRVAVQGKFFQQENGEPQLLQLLIFCCAADALPVTVDVRSDPPLAYFPKEQIEVIGQLHFAKQGQESQRRPWIEVESSRSVVD